jgi:predicted nucleic acid-binding protein
MRILIHAAFGQQVRHILKKYEDQARFYTPDVALGDARKYVVAILELRQVNSSLGLSVLDQLAGLVEQVDRSLYEQHEQAARERIDRCDPDDWPVVAVALLLRLPIWTEDQDFFGSGMATWTTDRVEVYLRVP